MVVVEPITFHLQVHTEPDYSCHIIKEEIQVVNPDINLLQNKRRLESFIFIPSLCFSHFLSINALLTYVFFHSDQKAWVVISFPFKCLSIVLQNTHMALTSVQLWQCGKNLHKCSYLKLFIYKCRAWTCRQDIHQTSKKSTKCTHTHTRMHACTHNLSHSSLRTWTVWMNITLACLVSNTVLSCLVSNTVC